MKYLILFVLPLLIMSADYETQKYDVVLKENNFEIRYYPPAIKAKVLSENGSNKNFMKLFKYISGNNSNNEKIAMTTPVYLSNQNNTNAMEFVMPAKFNMENISKPNDDDYSFVPNIMDDISDSKKHLKFTEKKEIYKEIFIVNIF